MQTTFSNDRAKAPRPFARLNRLCLPAMVFFCGVLMFGTTPGPDESPLSAATSVALVGALVYTAPDESPIVRGTVLVIQGRIAAVGDSTSIAIPEGIPILNCQGMTVTAAFWNCHVHFIEAKWNHPATIPSTELAARLREMLIRYGFVHVFETASFDINTALVIRRRIRSGEIIGPEILTAGEPLVPPGGTPAYILPRKFAEIGSPADAIAAVRTQVSAGANGIKLFVASPTSHSHVAQMALPVAQAVVAEAHERGVPVFAHPTNVAGVETAVESGIDILAHTSPDSMQKWPPALVRALVDKRVALIPTLKLYDWDPRRAAVPQHIVRQVREIASSQLRDFSRAGGDVLFGTDVGYMTDYDPTDEYVFMQEAGLSWSQILASLTSAPAKRFGKPNLSGLIRVGFDANLVVLGADPAANVRALSDVRRVFIVGRLAYVSGPDPKQIHDR